jgi:Protein of unknown function (DUF4245)
VTEEPEANAQLNAKAAGESGPAAGPVPKPAKPRLLQDGRDMFWSLIPLVIGCILLAGAIGMCSFLPGHTNRGAIPPYDVARALKADAETLKFPIRQPRLPAGWQANSGGRDGIPNGRTDPATGQRANATISTVGYIDPTGMYMRLTQSNADEDKLVGSIHASAYPTGTADVGGTAWVIYQGTGQSGADAEPIWTTRLNAPSGATQIAITGAGGTEDFRTLASATQSQPPLAPQR